MSKDSYDYKIVCFCMCVVDFYFIFNADNYRVKSYMSEFYNHFSLDYKT